jgi:hypothetical protein
MSALPLAVRVAAGLAAAAVERARRLPNDLVGLPVTAASRAMQVSIRVQQQITELAIKGDNAIALLRTPSENPPWAVFDEDQPPYRPPGDRTDSAAIEAARDWQDAEDADDGEMDIVSEPNHAPGVLGGYSELSLASLRGRLRMFGIDELQTLLDYEQAHLNRPEFVRMLTNRIKTVRYQ